MKKQKHVNNLIDKSKRSKKKEKMKLPITE